MVDVYCFLPPKHIVKAFFSIKTFLLLVTHYLVSTHRRFNVDWTLGDVETTLAQRRVRTGIMLNFKFNLSLFSLDYFLVRDQH